MVTLISNAIAQGEYHQDLPSLLVTVSSAISMRGERVTLVTVASVALLLAAQAALATSGSSNVPPDFRLPLGVVLGTFAVHRLAVASAGAGSAASRVIGFLLAVAFSSALSATSFVVLQAAVGWLFAMCLLGAALPPSAAVIGGLQIVATRRVVSRARDA